MHSSLNATQRGLLEANLKKKNNFKCDSRRHQIFRRVLSLAVVLHVLQYYIFISHVKYQEKKCIVLLPKIYSNSKLINECKIA